MTIDEIMAIIVGTIMIITLSIMLIAIVIMSLKDYFSCNRKKALYNERQKRDMNCYLRGIAQELYEINKTLHRKEIKNNEKR